MENCVFCDKSQFEERLCGETKDFWIIATLGQITDGGYLLLVPKRHVDCVGAMRINEIRNLILLMNNTARTQRDLYRNLNIEWDKCALDQCTIFEHGVVGQTIKHAHIHIMPQRPHSLHIEQRIKKDFPQCKIEYLPLEKLIKLYRLRKTPYLYWQEPAWDDFPSGGFKVCWNPPAPLQYMRIVIADALGRPERANWRNMDPELDKKLWSETVKRLKPYFASK